MLAELLFLNLPLSFPVGYIVIDKVKYTKMSFFIILEEIDRIKRLNMEELWAY